MMSLTKKPRLPTKWREVRVAIGTDARTGQTIYEVREERRLSNGMTETRRAVKRYEK
jgi:hypothetical protein